MIEAHGRRLGLVALVVAVGLTGASCDAGGRSEGSAGSASACPEYPVFDRNLDADPSGRDAYPDEPGFATPEAAVRSVAGDEIEVVAVRTSGPSSEVDVRLADEVGTFYVQLRHVGWQVKGGDGCAAWPAAEKVVGPLDLSDCSPTPSIDPNADEQWVQCLDVETPPGSP